MAGVLSGEAFCIQHSGVWLGIACSSSVFARLRFRWSQDGVGKQQIPCGNDNKKSTGKSNGDYTGRSRWMG